MRHQIADPIVHREHWRDPSDDTLRLECGVVGVWGAGKEYPVRGEDFAFMLFRKRNCCVGY